MGIFDKVKSLVGSHGDKVADGVDKATDVIDDKTEGKFHDHLEKVDEFADKLDDGDAAAEGADGSS
jgi:hypothetical protein